MSWINENKFVAGFTGFMILGAGALGYLLYSAAGSYDEVHTAYTAKLGELKNLQSQAPFPNQDNLNKFKKLGAGLDKSFSDMQSSLSELQFPVEPISPTDFQNKLRAAVNADLEKATANHVIISDKAFAIGFDRYLTEVPKAEAAPWLGFELKAIDLVVNQLLDRRVYSIVMPAGGASTIDRTPLPEETGAKTTNGPVNKFTFDISFISDQGKFRTVLNDLASDKKQFYIVRQVEVMNEKPEGPAKTTTTTAPPAQGAKKGLQAVLGAEKVKVTLKIEIVTFKTK